MKPLPVRNKLRGKAFERKIVKIFQDAGIKAKRAWGSDGRSLGLPEYVDVEVGEKNTITYDTIQCKRVKRLSKKIQLKENLSVVVIQEDGGPPLVILALSDYIRKVYGGRSCTDNSDRSIPVGLGK